MLKVVYIYHSLSAFGGLERVLSDKMNYLAEHYDIEIHFITCDQKNDAFSYPLSPKVKHQDLGGLRYHDMYKHKYPYRLIYMHKFEKDFRKRLLEKLDMIRPDILISTTSFATTLIANLRYPCIKILESHIAQPFIMKAGPKHAYLGKFEYAVKSIYDWYFCRVIKKYNSLVVLTQQDVADWKRYRKALCIYNPITSYPETIHHPSPSHHQIIAVGRLYGQKGYDLLIAAWSKVASRYPDWSISIYGDGNEKQDYLNLIQQYGLQESVHIHPAVSNIYDKYQESDFLVLSSRAEGFGLVLAEAMSCGIPCVSFDCPSGPNEIITNNKDGILVKNGDIDELARQMEWMITHEKERAETGIHARESAKRFKKEVIMQQWMDLFNRLTTYHKHFIRN